MIDASMAPGEARRRAWWSRPLSTLLVVHVGASPLAASAAPSRGPAAVVLATGPAGDAAAPTEDIGELWQQAQARIDTSEYGEAIELLTRLYEIIALDPDAEALRLRVQWALHRAHLGAHGVDGDPEHLFVARDLLDKYVAALSPGEVDRREEAEAAVARVRAALDEHEAAEAAAQEADRAEARRAAAEQEAERSALEPLSPEPDEPPTETTPEPSDHRGMIIGGAVGAGLGLVGFGVMAGGLGSANAAIDTFKTQPEQRNAARDDIRRGNTVAIVGAAAGGAFLMGGAVLLAVGLRRRAAVRGSLALGPGQLGLAWRVRW